MAGRPLLLLLALSQAHKQLQCEDCTHRPDETSMLQAQQAQRQHAGHQLPHVEATIPSRLLNTKDGRLSHHSHTHAKVVDDTDYREDARVRGEQAMKQSLDERCSLKRMTLEEVHHRWAELVAAEKAKVGHLTMDKMEDLRFAFNSVLNNNQPVMVQDVPRQLGWHAAGHWGAEELSKFLGDHQWERQSFDYPDWIFGLKNYTSLSGYLKRHESSTNVFLFASEPGCDENKVLKSTVDVIRGHITPSPDFAYGPEWCQAIIAIDGIGASHGFHNHDPVWNVQVTGWKQWWLMPPHSKANWQNEFGMEWGGAPLTADGTPFEMPNGCAMVKQATPPPGTQMCVTGPGEMILLPDSWIHATCGLTEFTVGAGGWLGGPARHDHGHPDKPMEK
ncbi:unnamed protein product [Effrenium voratum]|uniref:Uncharacterized protein n=1 Tax=Effrenium voratum TaxID=2562239 RepID=A0AA36NBR1_9DINO|nr:unnamed protein product [Effrenium voratum]